MRIHKKIWLWWNKWYAIQFTNMWDEYSLGVRINTKRPMIDFYFGGLTISLGKHAVYTDPRTRHWDSCRGMLFPDNHKFPLSPAETEKIFGKTTQEAQVL